MGLNRAMQISLSGVEAERIAMELIASNLANINTTRTVYGGPYRRLVPVMRENDLVFAKELDKAEKKLVGGGVEVAEVVEDQSSFQKVYKPSHPDADKDGFVNFPNVKMSEELVNQIYTSRLYEANITAFNATKKMMQDTLQMQ